MFGLVYRAFDMSNGKSYVGQTTKTLAVRKASHLDVDNPRNHCRKFKHALRKRVEMFEWSVLTECRDIDELNAAEAYWIMFFDSIMQGYNLREGGGARGKASEETKQIQSAKTKNAWESGKMTMVGGKVSSTLKNRIADGSVKPGMLGKRHSLETILKMQVSAKRARAGRL